MLPSSLKRCSSVCVLILCSITGSIGYAQDGIENYDSLYYNSDYDATMPAPYRFEDRRRPPIDAKVQRPSFLYAPSYTRSVQWDTSWHYTLSEKIGETNYRAPMRIPFEVYEKYRRRESIHRYWQRRTRETDGEHSATSRLGTTPRVYVGPWLDRVFGGNFVSFEPNILFTLDLGPSWEYIGNPSLPINRRRNFLLDFNQQLSTNVVGKIGDKLDITFNYDTQSPFGSFNANFKNNVRIEYTGYDSDIIKKMILGNVSMPIENSLIYGTQNLFGLKTQLQFGKFYITSILSSQRGTSDNLSIDTGVSGNGGTQQRAFSILASDYVSDRHFFLSHFFRENYETWLSQRPQIVSGINVTRVEVYVLNRNQSVTNLRNILACIDLGEPSRIYRLNHPRIGAGDETLPAANASNQLFNELTQESTLRDVHQAGQILSRDWSLEQALDYEIITSAERLPENAYTIHPQLGYVSLTRALQNDEVLAVSYEYTYNGARYKVGELSEDYQSLSPQQAIFLKLLRPSRIRTDIPSWDLMMKNIYSLQTGTLNREGFSLQITYRDDVQGLENPTLNEGTNTRGRPLIELLGLDRLNVNNDVIKDGNFDYIDHITVNTRRGEIIFPVLEPFGSTLESYFDPDTEQALIDKYVYEPLYRGTQADAERISEFNKYKLAGTMSSANATPGSIQLPPFGIVENSIRVTAGGVQLKENIDYTVDYNLGRVSITNESILSSGKKIDVSYERSDFLSTQNRTLMGVDMEYKASENLRLGASMMYLTDQAGNISRYNLGAEPIRNVKYGLSANWERESLFLTQALDKLPLLSTKEPSSVRFTGEFAQLLPGTSNQVDGQGTFYIDDFESAAQPLSLANFRSWQLAAVPQVPGNVFNQSTSTNPLGYGYRRAKLAWYMVDNAFYRSIGSAGSANLGEAGKENHYSRSVSPNEIFPLRDAQVGQINEQVFDLAYYPAERGPYNYAPQLTEKGKLLQPRMNWGGITRSISNEVDFDKANIQYLEFWLMDPFISGEHGRVWDGEENQNNMTGGRLVFNLGEISEDVIPDSRHGFENGLPEEGGDRGIQRTAFGKVPDQLLLTRAFTNDTDARSNQDVGLDGLRNDEEARFFEQTFLAQVPASALPSIQEDVSADNFKFYLDETLEGKSITERYKFFNNMDGNTPLSTRGENVGSNFPDNEDLNRDNRISNTEAYYEYTLSLQPGQMEIGTEHIVDKVTAGEVDWYLFRIPIREPHRIEGAPTGFKSIRFVRMYLTDFEQPVVLRFVQFRLVGSQWIVFEKSLALEGVVEDPDTRFELSTVNLEENSTSVGGKSPYVIPPGIRRDQNDLSFNFQRYNEQSLQLCVEDLAAGDARAVYKLVGQNLINYQRLHMFFHAHGEELAQDDLEGFIRIGSDIEQNYYEISLKLRPTISLEGDRARAVWPIENEIDLELAELSATKLQRDREGISVTERFLRQVNRYDIYVVGRPKISDIQVIAIGTRRPLSAGSAKSGCVWANELRATGINKKQGWATNLRMDTQLADFAEVSLSTQYSTPGFGNVQDRVQARSLQRDFTYDASSTVHLDKLIPVETGIQVPMFVSYEHNSVRPEFDPLNPDVTVRAASLSREGEERMLYDELVEESTQRRSINFSNVRKTRLNPNARVDVFDVENFSFTYSYSDKLYKHITIDHDFSHQSKMAVAYDFSVPAHYFEPFKKWKSRKYLKWLNDLSLWPAPYSYSFNFSLDRNFRRRVIRSADLSTENVEPIYEKAFFFNRDYGVQWNIFRALTLQYQSQATAIIDEPEGDINEEARSVIWENIKDLGRLRQFTQNTTLNYTVPLNKLPLLDWTKSRISYAAGYMWHSGANEQRNILGNTIENSRQMNYTLDLSMQNLYKKLRKSSDTKTSALLFPLTMLRDVRANYSQTWKTFLPGFLPEAEWLGNHLQKDAPGFSFIFGSQDKDIRWKAARSDWLVRNEQLSQPFWQEVIENLSLQSTITPLSTLDVRLSSKRATTGRYEELFRYNSTLNTYEVLSPTRRGGYSISFWSFSTAFTKQDKLFEEFDRYRTTIRSRLESGTTKSYNLQAQDVLIPAFIAAYGGREVEEVPLHPFPRIPLPGWQINYRGLAGLPMLSEIFSAITLSHNYSSTYAVGSFTSSLLYDNLYLSEGLLNYRAASVEENGMLIPFYVINGVSIVESFSPLLGIQMSLPNNSTFHIDFRRRRQLSLNLSNTQLNESRVNDLSFNYGYTQKNFRLPARIFGASRVLNNTLNVQIGFAISQQEVIQRSFGSNALSTAGNTGVQFNVNTDYSLNQFLNLQFYIARQTNQPALSTSFRRARTAVGFRMRVNWVQ